MTMANKPEKYFASPSMNQKFRHNLNQSYDRLNVETQIYLIDVQLNFGSAIEANIDSLLGGEVQWHKTGHFLDWADFVLFLLRVAFHSIEKISLRKRAPICRWKSRLEAANSNWSSGVEKIGKRRKSPVPQCSLPMWTAKQHIFKSNQSVFSSSETVRWQSLSIKWSVRHTRNNNSG